MSFIIISKLLNWASAVRQNYYSSIYCLPYRATVWGQGTLARTANITVLKKFYEHFLNYCFHKSMKKLQTSKMRIIIISKLLNWASAVRQN